MNTVIAKKRERLQPLVDIDTKKCVNCHACIHVCPVKFCNNGTGDVIEIDHDLCIGCGACIQRCTHGARCPVDDLDAFIHHSLVADRKTVAVVAPSAVVNFGGDHLRLNGWLVEACGVEAVFDASFGAELAARSYEEHIKAHPDSCLIAQPCPAIVSFIELYLPDLIPHLAPVDSPLVHTMKMIREFFPQYAEHQIVAITPCMAKKREFLATKLGDYNVSFRSIKAYMEANKIRLQDFAQVDYVNPLPERAVRFSTPGGLLRTLERSMPEARERTRKIEGRAVYDYLTSLPDALEGGSAPLLVDCLNCELGCNGGPLSEAPAKTQRDHVEGQIEKRFRALMEEHRKEAGTTADGDYRAHLDATLSLFWKEGLYERKYRNHSANNRLEVPSEPELRQIYRDMGKRFDRDLFNCDACGYGSCENMAIAIHNNLNKAENCHFYMANTVAENDGRLKALFTSTSAGMCVVDPEFNILFANNALCTLFGTTKDRIQGTQLFKAQFEAFLSNERPIVEFRIKRPDGTHTNCLFNASEYRYESPLGERVGYFALVTDITRTRQVQGSTMKLEEAKA